MDGGGATARAAARLAAAAARPAAPVLGALDAAALALGARPLLLLAGAVAALPALRLAAPGEAGSAAAALLAAAAASGILLAAASRLHAGAEGALVRRALVAGFLARLACAAVLGALGGFPDERGYYDSLARTATRDWAAGGASVLADHAVTAGRWVYFYLLSGAYAVFGDSLAVGRILGAVLGLAAALLCGEVARGLAGRRGAALAVVLLALHPEHAFWSATVARDTLSTVLVLAALAVAVRRDGALLRGGILAAAPFLALLAGNAILPAAALGAGLGAALLVEAAAGLRSGPAGLLRAAAVAAVASLPPALLLRRWGPWITAGNIGRVRAGIFKADAVPLADFLPGFRPESFAGLAAFLPAGAAFVLLAPWPWDATHALRAAYAPAAAIGAVAALAGAAGLVRAVREERPGSVAASVFALALLVELALLQGQSGILVRHRLPLTAVLAAAVPWPRTGRDPLPPPRTPAR